MNIYVGNLNFKVDENDLKEVFEEYGQVTSVKIITDKFSGRSRGFGFVEMDNDSEAAKAIQELNGATLENREMVVNEAKERRNNFKN
jgi:RNA recognition motif-containing protein